MRRRIIAALLAAGILSQGCGGPAKGPAETSASQAKQPTQSAAAMPEKSTVQVPGGKTMEITVESGVPDSEVGLPRYPVITKYVGPTSYSKRSTPISVDYSLDFETVDSMAVVEKFYSDKFTVKSRQSSSERISLAGTGKDCTIYSVTASRPKSSVQTTVNVRAYRKK